MTATASTDAPPHQGPGAKRARLLAATGLPAVLIAGGALLPGIANAAPGTATGAACPAGSRPSAANVPAAVANDGAPLSKTSSAPAKSGSPAPTSVPSPSGSASGAGTPTSTPAPPRPTGTSPAAPTSGSSAPTTAKTSNPPTTTTTPTSAPTSTTSTPTQPPPTWWDPFTWFGATTASLDVFNPQPAAQSGTRSAAVNQLGTTKQLNPAAVAAAAVTSAPTSAPSSAPTSAPSTAPSTAPSSQTPTTPTPTGTASHSTPPPTTSSSVPSLAPSAASTTVCVKAMTAGSGAEALWHLDASSLTLNWLTYNGVVTINTTTGPVNVLDFTASSADLVSMVTDSANPGNAGITDYANGGQGETVHLTNVHLHVLQQTGNLFGLIPVTLAPGNAITTLLGIAQGVPVPLPVTFTDVHVDQYELTADTLTIPGFDVNQK